MSCLTRVCGHENTDSRGLLFVSFPPSDGGRPSDEEHLHSLSVFGAHVVVDEDVEGGVSVGSDLQEPENGEVCVL